MDRFDGRSVGRTARLRLSGAVLCCAFVLAACGSAPPAQASPEAIARETARLLEPFQVERNIVADRVEIVMTANFRHALEPVRVESGVQEQERVERPDGGYELVYRNRSPRGQLLLRVGKTSMYVLREARVVVLGGSSAYRLEATCDGDGDGLRVSVVEADSRVDCRQARISDGVFERVR